MQQNKLLGIALLILAFVAGMQTIQQIYLYGLTPVRILLAMVVLFLAYRGYSRLKSAKQSNRP